MSRVFVAITIAVLTCAVPRAGQAEITGRATVIDGDTIEIHGERIRLDAIDAPESGQTCRRDGEIWRCGQKAALALAEKIGQSTVRCEDRGRGRYGRIIAICFARGEDLNAWLVAQGWALAYRRYSTEYVSQEEAARAAGLNIWRGEFVAPWEWRRGKRFASEPHPPPMDCPIKGNISSKGERIYHVPGGRWYDRTRIDSSKGERWFCTEEEALAAGWRRARQ